MFQDIFLFETRTGDEKDDKNSLQRFGVLHLLQRELLEGSVADVVVVVVAVVVVVVVVVVVFVFVVVVVVVVVSTKSSCNRR